MSLFHICLLNRCFLSAGSPTSSQKKSRVVEALCIHLCQKHSVSKRQVKAGKVTCTTRWKLVISNYNSIQARILNTSALEGTNLILYNLETTLIKWYKDDVRRNEIRMLLQDLPPSHMLHCLCKSKKRDSPITKGTRNLHPLFRYSLQLTCTTFASKDTTNLHPLFPFCCYSLRRTCITFASKDTTNLHPLFPFCSYSLHLTHFSHFMYFTFTTNTGTRR